eukprot:scaffold9331_cov116-Isochrysis_galbana.AAC.9
MPPQLLSVECFASEERWCVAAAFLALKGQRPCLLLLRDIDGEPGRATCHLQAFTALRTSLHYSCFSGAFHGWQNLTSI